MPIYYIMPSDDKKSGRYMVAIEEIPYVGNKVYFDTMESVVQFLYNTWLFVDKKAFKHAFVEASLKDTFGIVYSNFMAGLRAVMN